MPDDQDLLHGPAEHIAGLLGCSVRMARRYKAGTTPLKEDSRRLLRLHRSGDLSALLGSAWAGFHFDRHGLLFAPGWSNGLAPGQIMGIFYTFQEAAALRATVKALKSEVWAMQKVQMVKVPDCTAGNAPIWSSLRDSR